VPARLRIQTIAFTTTLIRAQHPKLGTLLERLERAVDWLTELSRAVTRYESMRLLNPQDANFFALSEYIRVRAACQWRVVAGPEAASGLWRAGARASARHIAVARALPK
jgi:hypothetical protein